MDRSRIMAFQFAEIHTFLFDFDGTLARLNIDFQAIRKEILSLARNHGLLEPALPDPPYLLECARAFQEQLASSHPAAAETFYMLARQLIEKREWEAAFPENLFSATTPLLRGLREKKRRVAILTRNSGSSVYRVFPDLDDYVDLFLPRERVKRPKPDPEHLRQAMEGLGSWPEQTVMVGDHPIDMISGKKAGVFTIGVLSGRTGEAEMRAVGPDLIIPEIGALLDLVL
jgi:phosphoglycolate phosphatase